MERDPISNLKGYLDYQIPVTKLNEKERYSRVPRLLDTRYSAKGTSDTRYSAKRLRYPLLS